MDSFVSHNTFHPHLFSPNRNGFENPASSLSGLPIIVTTRLFGSATKASAPRRYRRRRHLLTVPGERLRSMAMTERSSLLLPQPGGRGDNNDDNGTTTSSVDLFEPVNSSKAIEDATHWFELSRTNFSPDGAPMWWWSICGSSSQRLRGRLSKPDDLGISTTLWQALATDLNAIYIRRIRFLFFLCIVVLLLSWPVCNLLFPRHLLWWTMAARAVPLLLFLRHELAFTNQCWIPLTFNDCCAANAAANPPHQPPKTKPPLSVVGGPAAVNKNNDDDLHPYYTAFHTVCAKYTVELTSFGVRASVMADEDGAVPQRAYLIFQPAMESGSEGLYFV
jgi:hypothetical protein